MDRDHEIYRKPISSTGSQVVTVGFDNALLNQLSQSNARVHTFGRETTHNIDERQILMAKKQTGTSLPQGTVVIGAANGLGGDIDKLWGTKPISEDLYNAVILTSYNVMGVSDGTYNVNHPRDEGFAMKVGGTVTLRVHKDTKPGDRLVVDLPTKADRFDYPDKAPGYIPFILRPTDGILPAHTLKRVVRSTVVDSSQWKELMQKTASFYLNGWKNAAKGVIDSRYMGVLSGIYVLIQLGLISYNQPIFNGIDWKGRRSIMTKIDDVYFELIRNSNHPNPISPENRIHYATAFVVILGAYLVPPANNMERFVTNMCLTPEDVKHTEELKKILIMTDLQDAESGSVTSFAQTRNVAGGVLIISTEIGITPTVYSPANDIIIRSSSVIDVIKSSKDNLFERVKTKAPYFVESLHNIVIKQMNHFTDSVTAYNLAIKNEASRIIGKAINGGRAGSEVDVALGVY